MDSEVSAFGWLHCFEPEVRQNIMAGGHGRGRLLCLEAKNENMARDKI